MHFPAPLNREIFKTEQGLFSTEQGTARGEEGKPSIVESEASLLIAPGERKPGAGQGLERQVERL